MVFESRSPKQQSWLLNRDFTVWCLYICTVM